MITVHVLLKVCNLKYLEYYCNTVLMFIFRQQLPHWCDERYLYPEIKKNFRLLVN